MNHFAKTQEIHFAGREAVCVMALSIVGAIARWQAVVRGRVRVGSRGHCEAAKRTALVALAATAKDAAQGVASSRNAHSQASVVTFANDSGSEENFLRKVVLALRFAPR